jgi:hypothetical protein
MKKTGGTLFVVLFVLLAASQSGSGTAQSFSAEPSLTWERIETSKMPSPRTGFSLALNETNQVALFFGGHAFFEIRSLNDLWLTNGSQWLEFFTPHRPPERSGSGLVYDQDRQEAVLFGGSGDVSYLNDTWIFNGFDWTEKSTSGSPSPRYGANMVYDPDHRWTYLFGGTYSLEKSIWLYNDTWDWDGTSWEQVQLDYQPDVRYNAAMAYDPVHHYVLLYGGTNAAYYLNDTWTWNGEEWTEQQPAHKPGKDWPFWNPKMVFDASRQQVVLVGPFWNYQGTYSETWVWDGQDWIELPVVRPLPPELVWHGKLVYLPGLQTVAMVNLFPQKLESPDATPSFVDRSEVWALVNRN